MIIEFADIEVKPHMAAQFIEGVKQAQYLFARAAGCHGMELLRYLEMPDHFTLVVKWETLAHHTEAFAGSEDFQTWRALVSDCFAGKPKVWHSETVVAAA